MKDESESNGSAATRPFWNSSYVGWALMGAIFLGVVVPCTLTWWHIGQGGIMDTSDDPEGLPAPDPKWHIGDLLMLYFLTGMFCGPGALILGSVVLWRVRRLEGIRENRLPSVLVRGALLGGLLAFVNLPGYLAADLLRGRGDPHPWLRLAAIFLVTGATCGAWIAWQAYREKNRAEPFFPRFSLRTLMLLVIAWGILAALFTPL